MGTHPIFESDFDCLTESKMGEGEIQIRFNSNDCEALNVESISIPLSSTPQQLKALVEGLIQTKLEAKEFDFLIESELLRSTISQHLTENEIETDKELEVIVVEKQSAPVPEHTYNGEDWISDIKIKGEIVLAAAYDGTLTLWDAEEEEVLFQIVAGRDTSAADPLKSCTFLEEKDEKISFVAGGLDSDLSVWKWDKNRSSKPKPIYSLRGHRGSVESIISLENGVIASTGYDKTIRIWRDLDKLPEYSDDISAKKKANREERGEVRTSDTMMEGHSESVMTLTKMSSHELVSGGMDNTIRVWDLNKMQEENVLQGVKANFCVDYSSKRKLLATGSSDRHIRLWDARTTTGKVAALALTSHSLWVSSVKWSPTKDYQLLSGSYDTVVKLWDIRSHKTPLFDLQKHNEKVLSLDWSDTTDVVVSGGADQNIHSYRFGKDGRR